jgi:hypothetical protein
MQLENHYTDLDEIWYEGCVVGEYPKNLISRSCRWLAVYSGSFGCGCYQILLCYQGYPGYHHYNCSLIYLLFALVTIVYLGSIVKILIIWGGGLKEHVEIRY